MSNTEGKPNPYNDDDRQYLQMMQSNIERMADNSANCKTWMVAFVTAFMALGSSIAVARYWLLLGIIPILLFWYLDTFYLHLERAMRNRNRNTFEQDMQVSALSIQFPQDGAKVIPPCFYEFL